MVAPCPLVPCTSARHGDAIVLLISLGLLYAAVLARRLPADSQAPPVADDRAISVGRWDVTAIEWNGKPVDPEILALLQMAYNADGSWSVLFRSIPVVEGRSTNRQHDSPKTFEMETLGSEAIKPSRYTGIYRVDGDTRVLCFVPDGTPRPDDFSAPRRSGRMLVTLKRPARPRSGPQQAGRRSVRGLPWARHRRDARRSRFFRTAGASFACHPAYKSLPDE